MKKNICAITFILFCIIEAYGQSVITTKVSRSPKYLWAKGAGGTDQDIANGVITDSKGNVLIVGNFKSPTITFGTTTLVNTGKSDIFLVKYNASGDVLWAISVGGTSWDYGRNVFTDKNDNIIITGSFESSSITFGTSTLSKPGSGCIFIAKYDTSGNALWAKGIGGSTNLNDQSVCTDASNNIIITGYYFTGTYDSNILINKYDASGNILWSKSVGGGSGHHWAHDVSVDNNGNILVVGDYNGTFTIGTTTLTNSTSSGYYFDIVILKYDPSGNFIWARTATGNDGTDRALSVDTDSNGNIMVTGDFACSTLNLGSTSLTSNSYTDVFTLKYDPNGNILWAKSASGRDEDSGTGISCDAGGNTIITGYFVSESLVFETDTLTKGFDPRSNIFIVKYNSDGNVIWAKAAGGSEEDRSNCVSVDINGNSIIVGRFGSASIAFGTNIIEHISGGSGTSDVFVTKLDYKGGLDAFYVDSDWAIYPNPSNGIFQVSNRISNISNLEINNLLGEKIYALEFSSDHIEINLSKLPKGLYFITLVSDTQRMTQKLILR